MTSYYNFFLMLVCFCSNLCLFISAKKSADKLFMYWCLFCACLSFGGLIGTIL